MALTVAAVGAVTFLLVLLLQATGLESGPQEDVWFVYAWISVILPVVALVLARRIGRVPQDRVRQAVAVPLLLTGAHVCVVAGLYAWLT